MHNSIINRHFPTEDISPLSFDNMRKGTRKRYYPVQNRTACDCI